MSPHDQIRLASNDVRLSQFSAGWEDEHALSQPLTGAFFDIAVDIFQEILVERGLIPPEVAEAIRKVRDEGWSQSKDAQTVATKMRHRTILESHGAKQSQDGRFAPFCFNCRCGRTALS